jgi:hypothetical protein
MTAEARESEIVAHNLGIFAEMRRIVQALDAAAVSCIVLKGIPLCHRMDDGFARRAIVDNDILVHRADVARAMEALEGLGYRSLSWRRLEQDLEESFEHPLSRPDVDGRPLFCELHWNAFPPSLFRARESTLWARTVEVDVLGARVLVFDPALQILHLASHVVQHELCEPRTLEVFGRAWSHWGNTIDYADLASLARELGIEQAFEYVVEMARALALTKTKGLGTTSRRVSLAKKLFRPERLLEAAEDEYPERYIRAMLVLMLVPPSRAFRHLLGRVLPAPDAPVRQRGRRAVALHYLARPWRPIARSAASGAGFRRVLAAREYIRVHRSLAGRYAAAALDRLLHDLESQPKSPHPLSVPELARAIRLAERLAPRLSKTPNTCLFRALSRYSLLNSHAYRASFVLGVATQSDQPGHAWVELAGEPFLESGTPAPFNRILARQSPGGEVV